MNYQYTAKCSYIVMQSDRTCCPLHTNIQYDSQILVQTVTYQIKTKMYATRAYSYFDRDKHSWNVIPAPLQNLFKKRWC